jgi:hypothetical protein
MKACAAPGITWIGSATTFCQRAARPVPGTSTPSSRPCSWSKAFNHIYAAHFQNFGLPAGTTGRVAILVAGEDPKAKAIVFRLVDEIAFDPVDAGGLAEFLAPAAWNAGLRARIRRSRIAARALASQLRTAC